MRPARNQPAARRPLGVHSTRGRKRCVRSSFGAEKNSSGGWIDAGLAASLGSSFQVVRKERTAWHKPTGSLGEIPAARPLVVDEAYFEYCGETAAFLPDVLVIRTALEGVRARRGSGRLRTRGAGNSPRAQRTA